IWRYPMVMPLACTCRTAPRKARSPPGSEPGTSVPTTGAGSIGIGVMRSSWVGAVVGRRLALDVSTERAAAVAATRAKRATSVTRPGEAGVRHHRDLVLLRRPVVSIL